MKRTSQTNVIREALGVGAGLLLLAACGGNNPPPPTPGVGWSDIQTDMTTKCSTALATCHSPTSTSTLKIGTDANANYTLVKNMFVNLSTPAMSQVLVVPQTGKDATGSMGNHTGGVIFATTTDATYQKWLKWIQAGAPQTAPAQ